MAFSQTAEYALRAVVWLAQNPGAPQTTHQLAAGTRVSTSYLPKVLKPLGRAGIVTSQRGINGGYTLNRNPDELPVLDVVNCVDPIQRITSCPLKLNTHGGALCPLHRLLDDTIAGIETRLRETTISELLRRETGSKPLCESGPPVIDIDLSGQLNRLPQSEDKPAASNGHNPSSTANNGNLGGDFSAPQSGPPS